MCQICNRYQEQYERAILLGDQNAADYHAQSLEQHQRETCPDYPPQPRPKAKYLGVWPGGKKLFIRE